MNSHHHAQPFSSGLPAEVTVKAAAMTIMQCIDLAKQRDAWRARIESLSRTYEKYGRTEEYVLEDRRLRTDIARLAIEKMAAIGDSDGILALFKDYNSNNYDYLGKVIELIGQTYRQDQ